MSITDDIKAAVAELRDIRRKPTRGQAIYELNIWLGEQRKALQAEYERKLSEIDAQPEPTLEDRLSPKVLGLVGQAVAQKVSRSNLRRALGLSTLEETDEAIRLASGHLHHEVQVGHAEPYILRPTGEIHRSGWPLYAVTLVEAGETYEAIYLVTTPRTTEVERRHLRIQPTPAGSAEILDAVWSSGAAKAIFARGKAEG